MAEIVVINHGTITDQAGFHSLADEAIDIVQRDLPETLRYDCYVDEENSRFMFHEAYASSEALLRHAQRLAAAGFMERLPHVVEFDAAFALGEVTPEVRQMIEPMGFSCMSEYGRARR